MSDKKLPNPISRREEYLNAIATGTGTDKLSPVTREEEYLLGIAENVNKGGSGDSSGGTSSADDVSYDNTASGLTATDVQAAIDEVAQGGSGGGTSYDIEVSGTITENLMSEAWESLDYKINSDMDTLLAKVSPVDAQGDPNPNAVCNLSVRSTVYVDIDVALLLTKISNEHGAVYVTTNPAFADQVVKGNGGSGTEKNAIVIELMGNELSRWNVESHDIVPQSTLMILYENSTDAEAGNHNVAYIVNVQLGG